MINISQIAEKGLGKLKDGEVGINIDAKSEDDAKYLENYFEFRGYDVKIDGPESKEGQGIVYPITVFHKMPVEMKSA